MEIICDHLLEKAYLINYHLPWANTYVSGNFFDIHLRLDMSSLRRNCDRVVSLRRSITAVKQLLHDISPTIRISKRH